LYTQVSGSVMEDGPVPGLVVRAASDHPDGGVIIVSIWEDQASFEAFRARLMAAFDKAGLGEDVRPVPEVYDSFDFATA
jgi:cytochrome c556